MLRTLTSCLTHAVSSCAESGAIRSFLASIRFKYNSVKCNRAARRAVCFVCCAVSYEQVMAAVAGLILLGSSCSQYSAKNEYHLPPRGIYALLATGGTSHHGMRMGTSHSKIYSRKKGGNVYNWKYVYFIECILKSLHHS